MCVSHSFCGSAVDQMKQKVCSALYSFSFARFARMLSLSISKARNVPLSQRVSCSVAFQWSRGLNGAARAPGKVLRLKGKKVRVPANLLKHLYKTVLVSASGHENLKRMGRKWVDKWWELDERRVTEDRVDTKSVSGIMNKNLEKGTVPEQGISLPDGHNGQITLDYAINQLYHEIKKACVVAIAPVKIDVNGHKHNPPRSIFTNEDIKCLNTRGLGNVINRYAQKGLIRNSTSWFSLMVNDLNLDADAYICCMMIRAHVTFPPHIDPSKVDIEGAVRWLRIMQHDIGINPNVIALNTIIFAYGRMGNVEKAKEFLNEMVKVHNLKPDKKTITSMIAACATAKDVPQARYYLQEMQNTYAISPDVRTYQAVIRAHAEVGDTTGVAEVVQMMRKSGLYPDSKTWNLVARAFAKKADKEGVASVLKAKVLKMDSFGFIELINVHSHIGRTEEAVYWFRELINSEVSREQQNVNIIIKKAANASLHAFAQAKDPVGAENWMNVLRNEYGIEFDTVSINILMRALVRSEPAVKPAEKDEKVENSWDKLMSVWSTHFASGNFKADEQTYFQVMRACSKRNDKEGTLFWFQHSLAALGEPKQILLNLMQQSLGAEAWNEYCKGLVVDDSQIDLERDII